MIQILFLYSDRRYEYFEAGSNSLKEQIKYWIYRRKDCEVIKNILILSSCCNKSQMSIYYEVIEEEAARTQGIQEAKEHEEYLRLRKKFEPEIL